MAAGAALAACSSSEGTTDTPEPIGSVSQAAAKPSGTNGDIDYCSTTVKCVSGEGHCDSDSECTGTGVVCLPDVGPKYNQPVGNDVCAPATCANGVKEGNETAVDCGGPCGRCPDACVDRPGGIQYLNGGNHFCRGCYCSSGQGDCDSTYECAPGLVCAGNYGLRFGFSDVTDVCVKPHCYNNVQDGDETEIDCGGADCGTCDLPCPGPTAGGADYCSACQCTAGQGDCDNARECAPGLQCLGNQGPRFNWTASTDVCLAQHCGNNYQDADETGIDCGGECGPCLALCTGTAGPDAFCVNCRCTTGQGDCDSNRECAPDLYCAANAGPAYGLPVGTDVCKPKACTSVANCPPEHYCSQSGECRHNGNPCTADIHCASGKACHNGTCDCATCSPGCTCGTGGSCDGNEDCNSGFTCVAGTCQNCSEVGCEGEPCESHGDCAPGIPCQAGVCQPECLVDCAPEQDGCERDLDCPAGQACIIGGGPRLNLPATTNVCLPVDCLSPNPAIATCGSASAKCGLCPSVPPDVCAGRECGLDPSYGIQCGPLDVPCIQGKIVDSFSATSLTLTTAPRPSVPTQDLAPLLPDEDAQEESPGSLSGNFNVDERGAASYTIPIVAPPGRNGLEPQIELRYNSRAPNGPVGIGWTIGGLSSIARCPKISATDGWAAQVKYDGTDALCLDGQRLIAVPGTNNKEYRTEIDTFQKVLVVNSENAQDHEPFFRVFGRDGRIYEYGGERNQRLYRDTAAGVVPRAWALSKIKDRAGNFMRFEYGNVQNVAPRNVGQSNQDTLEFFPSSIAYGGLDSDLGTIEWSRAVKFEYGDDRQDFMEGFTPAGARIVRSKLLKTVRTVLLDNEVRSYELSYEYAPSGLPGTVGVGVGPQGPSRLQAVKECSKKNGVRVCKRPTTFTYSDERGFHPNTIKASSNLVADDLIKLDFNGDGIDDFLVGEFGGAVGTNWKILFGSSSRATPIQFELPTSLTTIRSDEPQGGDITTTAPTACFSQNSIADLNGDGRDEIVDTCWGVPGGNWETGAGNSYIPRYRVYTMGPSGNFTSYDVPVNPPPSNEFWTPKTYLIDVDGDGLRDIFEHTYVGEVNDRGNSHFYRGRADGTFDPNPAGVIESGSQWTQEVNNGRLADLMFVADVTGDGRPSVLVWADRPVVEGGSLVDVSGWARYAVAPEGQAHWERVTGPNVGANRAAFESGAFKLLDVNGDGLKDWLWLNEIVIGGATARNARLDINGGTSFFSTSQALSTTDQALLARFTPKTLRNSIPIDYDGDGAEDLLSLLEPKSGDPAGSGAHWLWNPTNTHVSSNNTLTLDPSPLSLSDPTSFFLQVQPGVQPWSNQQTNSVYPTFTMADADGDGSDDLVQMGDDGKLAITYGQFGRENLLTRVVDGTGKSVDVRYDRTSYFTDGSSERTYKPATPCHDASQEVHTQCIKRVGPLVSSYTIGAQIDEDSNVAEMRYRYRYEDARRGLGGRGWLGFGLVKVQQTHATAPTEGLIEQTEIQRDNRTFVASGNLFPYAGLETSRSETTPQAQSSIEKNPAWRVNVTGRTWELGTSSRGAPFVFVRTKVGTVYDLSGSGVDFKVDTYRVVDIDGFGNIQQSTVETNVNGSVVSFRRTTSDFDSSPARQQAWLISLLRKQSVEVTTSAASSAFTQTRTTAWDYDDVGLLSSITREPDETSDLSLRQTTTFNRDGNPFRNVRRVTVAGSWRDGQATLTDSRSTTLQYDEDGIFPRRVVNHVGSACPILETLGDQTNDTFGSSCLIEDLRFDARDGTLVGKVNPNGVAVQASHDAFGRILSEVSPVGTTTTLYQDAEPFFGIRLETIAAKTQVVSFNHTTGTQSRRVFDPLGRLVQVENPGLDGDPVLQEFSYAWGGLLASATRPHLDGDDSQGTVYNRYDARWRRYRTDFPDGSSRNFVAASAKNLTSTLTLEPGELSITGIIDANQHASYQFKDFRGQVARSLDASSHSTRYAYGAFGELRRVTDPVGNVTSVDVDRLGRTTQHSDGDTGIQTYTYTAFDELFVHTDGVGTAVPRRRVHSYDHAGRLETIQAPEGPTSFSYDIGPNAMARMVEMASPTGHVERYDYEAPPANGDARTNRAFLSKTTRHIDGVTYETSLHYDTRHLMDRITYPAAMGSSPFELHYTYDTAGYLQRADRSVAGVDVEFLWERGDSFQGVALASETFGNDVTTTYGRNDDNGRQTSITTTDGSAQVLQKIEYVEYDFNGNPKHRRSSFRNPSTGELDVADETFIYDEQDRLTHYPPGSQATPQVSYDALGNITSKEGVGTYNYAETGKPLRPHAVQNITRAGSIVAELDYDDYGNVSDRSGEGVPGGTQQIQYSSFNLPVSATVGTGSPLTYEYDAARQRVLFKAGNCGPNPDGTCIKRSYVGREFQRETGTDAGGSYTRNLFKIFIGKREILQIQNEIRNGQSSSTRRYLHADRLGSAQIVTDEDGDVTSIRRFSPFGELVSTGPDAITKVRTGFTGHETDIETGLVNMRGRTYDPRLGRFLQADPPFSESPFWSQGLNRYSYVFNNPLRLIDPTGFEGDESAVIGSNEVSPEWGVTTYQSDYLPMGLASDPAFSDVAPGPIDSSEPILSDGQYNPLDGEASQSDPVPREDSANMGGAPGQAPRQPIDVFAWGSYSKQIPFLPYSPEAEGIAIIGYSEDKGWYVAEVFATGHNIGGESNYVEALVGVETIFYFSSGEIHTESIALAGVGLGPEAPGVAGLGVTAGGYMTPGDSGAYVGLQGGALGEHGAAGVGWATEQSPSQQSGPEWGTEGNRSY